jgi:NhaA family Na+:H+ antiporter
MAPYVTLLVLPVFALANAGVRIEGAGAMLLDPVCLGVVIGLVLGKPLGITALSWLAVRAGLARLPAGVTWSQVVAVSVLAGIGFTMSLFIAGLAFEDPALGAAAKAGVLGASLVAGVVGLGLVRRATAPRGELRAAPAGA